ncbi:MAG: helix-turn-helix transcriptional regulator [Clostridiales bacterium]|jgi:DNA-binding Xre family transcriptional regulator|nr:helix-turn-helix transcriptional regulator [Clostridiales bacterium]
MRASYKKLWKLLIDRDMKKTDLAELANVSVATLTKLSKCENVNVDILVRICSALECEMGDIMELVGNDIEEQAGKGR